MAAGALPIQDSNLFATWPVFVIKEQVHLKTLTIFIAIEPKVIGAKSSLLLMRSTLGQLHEFAC